MNNATYCSIQYFLLFSCHYKRVRIYQVAYIEFLMENLNQKQGKEGLASHRRRMMMDKIRTSLQLMPLVSQNQDMVRSRIKSQGSAQSEEEDTDGSTREVKQDPKEVFQAEIFEEKYQLIEKLGEGSNGVVHRCKKRKTGEQFAAKSFRFEEEHLLSLKANFLYLKRLNHPHIIRYEGLYLDTKKYIGWLVMELVKFPSLLQAKVESENQIRDIMKKILTTLKYLHNHDIVHRDIKPENILYDPITKGIKLIDFGISRRFRRRGSLFDMLTITGTLYYRAPEMFSGGYREGVDVWAAGILLYRLVCGSTPFQSQYHSQTIKNIIEANLDMPQKFSSYSPKLKSLLQRMLTKNSQSRPTAGQCLRDVWFASGATSHLCRQTTVVQFSDDQEQAQRNLSYATQCLQKKPISLIEANMLKESDKHFEKCKTLSGIHSYIKRINGDEIHCIDSEDEQ